MCIIQHRPTLAFLSLSSVREEFQGNPSTAPCRVILVSSPLQLIFFSRHSLLCHRPCRERQVESGQTVDKSINDRTQVCFHSHRPCPGQKVSFLLDSYVFCCLFARPHGKYCETHAELLYGATIHFILTLGLT